MTRSLVHCGKSARKTKRPTNSVDGPSRKIEARCFVP
ncbi:hypothetical protein EDD90_4583 [Streptomyces sp. Ag109_O5-1]|nr:hypothetical protein EDD90_4583 [Streptomyces sp. Ag109_O5-1]